MVQNGILLIFTRLATVCLCLTDILLKAAPTPGQQVFLERHSQTKARADLPPCPATEPDMGLLLYGSQSTSFSVHFVHCTLSICLFPLVDSLAGVSFFPKHLAFCSHCLCPSVLVHLFMCVESLLELAGQGGALNQMDFSQH